MKRPAIDTLYGPAPGTPAQIGLSIVDKLTNRYQGYLSRYYATVAFSNEDKCFIFRAETMDLSGRDDLAERLRRDGAGMFSCDINLDFASTETYTAVFPSDKGGDETCILFSTDEELTSFVEEEDAPQMPYVLFLVELARLVESNWFFSGLRVTQWKPLTLDLLMDARSLSDQPYVIGWNPAKLDEPKLIASLGVDSSKIKRTLLGFNFVDFFPAR